jgi:hypothetical protein
MAYPDRIYQSPKEEPTWLGAPWKFLGAGFGDLWRNLKRTWSIILAFVIYLFVSAWLLYGLWSGPTHITSWIEALYSTWLSMSTAGYLRTSSPSWVWALGTANSLVGLLFFGLVIWLVTQSLYRPRLSEKT